MEFQTLVNIIQRENIKAVIDVTNAKFYPSAGFFYLPLAGKLTKSKNQTVYLMSIMQYAKFWHSRSSKKKLRKKSLKNQ